MNEKNNKVVVEAVINLPIEKVWNYWNEPEHIMNWYFASPDWHAPLATNDLVENGKLFIRMEARDGSFGFDYVGKYEEVVVHERATYGLEDGRKVKVEFIDMNGETKVVESFDPEGVNPIEMQRAGWQAILDNFKKYAESL